MSDAASAEAPPAAAATPFLESAATDPPLLLPLQHPATAVNEMLNRTLPAPVELPVRRPRGGERVYFEAPAKTSSPAFKQAYAGFMSAHRCAATNSVDEARQLVAAEFKELADFAVGAAALDGSLPPRGFAASLLLPERFSRSGDGFSLIDGFSAISQVVGTDGAGATTKCRFSIFGDTAVAPALSQLQNLAFGSRAAQEFAVLLSWTEAGAPGGEATIRCEVAPLTKVVQSAQEAANHLQALLARLAREFGVSLPPSLYLPARACDREFESMVKSSAAAFVEIMNREDPFAATSAMASYECERLQIVPGVFVRLSAKARGAGGVTDNDALHGFLLCADGLACEARAFALEHREGLPQCAGGKHEALLLHVSAAQCEVVHLAGAVSLYGVGGVPGAPISPPGTLMRRSVAAIVPLGWLQLQWSAFSCSMKSVIPSDAALTPFVDANLRRATDVFNRAFNSRSVVHTAPPEPRWPPPSPEEKFLFAAFGLNLSSRRTCLGEAIVQLMETGAASLLVAMLTKVGEKIGLSAPLEQAFSSAFAALQHEEEAAKTHAEETSRLKRVAEAALLVGCKRKAVEASRSSSLEKVRSALKLHCLVNGRARVKVLDQSTPRSLALARSLAEVVVEAHTQSADYSSPHMTELTGIFVGHEELALAIARAFRVCMSDASQPCFLVEHGVEPQRASVRRVTPEGELARSSAGELFESECPRVVLVKRQNEKCMATSTTVANPV